jgi:hypothetical protein
MSRVFLNSLILDDPDFCLRWFMLRDHIFSKKHQGFNKTTNVNALVLQPLDRSLGLAGQTGRLCRKSTGKGEFSAGCTEAPPRLVSTA